MPSYAKTILNENPAAYYKFDEYRGFSLFNFSDTRGNGDCATGGFPLLKQPSIISDDPSGSQHFNTHVDGYSGSVDSAAGKLTGNGALTIIGLCNVDSLTGSLGNATGYITRILDGSFALQQANDRLGFRQNGILYTPSIACLVAGSWIHFALTRAIDGVTLKFYVAGAQVGSNVVAGAIASLGGSKSLAIAGGDSFQWYKGSLDDLAIFPGVEMPSWKILNIYNSLIHKWPNTLNPVFDQISFEETLADTSLRTSMTYGPPKTRPIMSNNVTVVKGLFQVNNADREAIEDFFFNTLESGSIPFFAQFRNEGSPIRYIFLSQPSFHDIEGGDFEASLEVAALP